LASLTLESTDDVLSAETIAPNLQARTHVRFLSKRLHVICKAAYALTFHIAPGFPSCSGEAYTIFSGLKPPLRLSLSQTAPKTSSRTAGMMATMRNEEIDAAASTAWNASPPAAASLS
jgi:hypothetical protein